MSKAKNNNQKKSTMKIQKLFLPFLILSFIFSGTLVQAQSKSEKEKAQQEKIMELEKRLEAAVRMQEADLEKILKESKRIQDDELVKILENQKKMQQKAMKQYEKAFDFQKDNYRRTFDSAKEANENLYKVVLPEMQYDFRREPFRAISNIYLTSSREKTSLTIHKELDDVTFDTKFKYEVTDGANGINFKVDGSMDEGTLLIKLIKPNGDVLQEIEISPLADISWNQDLRWDDDEEQDENLGSWVIVVSAKNASGNYQVNVRAN